MSLPKLTKYIVTFAIVFIALMVSSNSYKAAALDAVKPDDSGNINVTEPKTNLTVAGNQVQISNKTSKDLIVAGSNIVVTGDIERNLIASGGNLDIQSKSIGASVRIAGGSIILKDTVIEEDLIVAAGTFTLSNVQVKGSTYFAGGTLDITNSEFLGDFNARYGTYKGDRLDEMAKGNIDASQDSKLNDDQKNYTRSVWDVFWPSYLGTLYGLIILLVFLNSKKALNKFEDIRWNSKFWMDMLVGLGFLILTPFVFIFSIFVLGFTLTGSLWTLIYSILFLSTAFLPFYLAKLLNSSRKNKTGVVLTSLLIWLLLLANSMLSNILPIVGIISFLVFLINLAAFGYIIRHILGAINKSFSNKEVETQQSINTELLN